MNRKYKYKVGQKVKVKDDDETINDPIVGKVGTVIKVEKDSVWARFDDVFNGSDWFIMNDDIVEIVEG